MVLYILTVKIWAQKLWEGGQLLALAERKAPTPGGFEVDRPNGVPVAHLMGSRRDRGDPNLFPPLHDVQFVKASGKCIRLRGWEKTSPRSVEFQEWIVDFHPDGYGRFGDEGDDRR